MNADSAILRNAAIVLFAIAPVIQTYFGRRARPGQPSYRLRRDAFRREGAAPFVLHVAAIFGLVALLCIYAAAPRLLDWSNLPLGRAWRWLGVGLGALSLVGLVEVHRQLGRQWSAYLELQENHQLITTGIYSRVRHPMYSVLILQHVAISLITANWAVIALSVLRVILFLERIRHEEAMLTNEFGDEYRGYARRTGRLWPRLGAP